ncbi:RNA-directed DNA polymerase, eukaryota [Tanacetum coccineum]
MGSFRTKEDDVAKISLSVYITNFPDTCSAKDLFHHCKQYGRVVDSYIPNKRSKTGKEDFRFKRPPVSGIKILTKNKGSKLGSSIHSKKQEVADKGFNVPNSSNNSFAQVVKGEKLYGGVETESGPAVVLDDECLADKDLSKSLLGRVKEFASLANLKVALCNEGFVDIKIIYMGELWVMLEFGSQETIKLFRDNLSVGSWFSCIKQATLEFVTEGRIACVEIEGIPFKLWSNNTFKRIANRWGVLLDIDDQEETCYHSKRLCVHMKSGRSILENFKIIHRGKVFWVRASETPGWVPDFTDESDDDEPDDEMSKDGGFNDHVPGNDEVESDMEVVPETLFEKEEMVKNEEMEGVSNEKVEEVKVLSVGKDNDRSCDNKSNNCSREDYGKSAVSGHFKKSMKPRTGGSIMGVLDELVKVGQVMGYNMEGPSPKGPKKDGYKIVVSKYNDHFLALTRSEDGINEFLCVKMCWGNLAFEYAKSDSVGVWRSFGQLVLLITVYAPHEVSEKQMLWDFLKWEISSSGLMEVSLGGSAYTWCHKSASKMIECRLWSNSVSIFHHWIEMEGFCKVVEDGWKESPCDSLNAMRNLLGKLKHLKKAIRVWNKSKSLCDSKALFISALKDVDSHIDNGNATEEDAKSRVDLISKICDIDKLKSIEMAQKIKVKWAVEGDENSSFFHGILNKKRNTQNIRGVMVNGVWLENPDKVKSEFQEHFSKRFCMALTPRD